MRKLLLLFFLLSVGACSMDAPQPESASDFTIEDLVIEDTAGDALKVNEGRNIVIRRVRTEWTNGPDEKNGAYSIYPVQTENVISEWRANLNGTC